MPRLKTAEETQSLGIEDDFPLISRFSLETYELFVKAPKPLQLVANLHEPRKCDALEIDVARCRATAYLHASVHPICIFSPLDEIVPAKGASSPPLCGWTSGRPAACAECCRGTGLRSTARQRASTSWAKALPSGRTSFGASTPLRTGARST